MIESTIFAEILVAEAASRGIFVTHMKLQKLVYYCQGYHLASKGTPLITGTIRAWEHGPVCEEIYQQYRSYGKEPIAAPELWERPPGLDESIFMVIDYVLNKLGRIGAWQLRNNTHQEEPWLDHCCEGVHDNEVITHEELEKFFTKEISVNEQDNEFARIMDASEYTDDELIVMPSTIATAEQFNEWVESL